MTGSPTRIRQYSNATVLRIRSSFGARLLGALLALVVLVAGTLLLFVHGQTEEQVRVVTARSAYIADRAFEEVEELHRVQLARLGRAFTGSRRTLAALEAALESGERGWLIETARYELELARAGGSVAAFTDSEGRVVATLIDDGPATGDPAGATTLAREVLDGGPPSLVRYRVVGGRLFTVLTERVELGGRAIGTIMLGMPVDEQVARHLADAAGVEVCFVAGGECFAGTIPVGSTMAARLAAVAPGSAWTFTDNGSRWVLHGEPVADETVEVRRVIAVPVDDVLAPFERIRRVLAWTSLVAVAAAFALATLLSHRLAGPVRELVAATRRLARGELRTRVPVCGTDELATLARSFNEMAEDLALKERYRDVLKKVVSREIADDLVSGELRLGGEVRTVTAVFADIVGFTQFASRNDPGTVIAVLNEYMTAWSRIVEEEGGIVDKYMGDAIMAVFGAPVSHADDAERAVRAALHMREATARLNAQRAARGLPGIELAIGIATGPAVAGNVGSPDRLNYTVIGDTVNLASRLCDAAGGGDILVSDATRRSVDDAVRIAPAGERTLKGMPHAVPVYAVDPRRAAESAPFVRDNGRIASAVSAGLVAATLAFAPTQSHAQDRGPGLPTLSGLGLNWISPSGTFQVDLSGQLDIEGYSPPRSPASLIPDVDPFVAGRMRLFADVFATDRIYGMLELRVDHGEVPAAADVEARIEQAFVRVAPFGGVPLRLQAGKFALPFGGWAARHHTLDDPLIRPPLAYDYRTLVSPTVVPAAAAGFLGWKDEATTRRPNGAPPVWSVPYPWGAMVSAAAGSVTAHAAVMSASPSSPPEQWSFDSDRFRAPSIVLGAAWQVVPELRVAAAFGRGPYLGDIESGLLPAGKEPDDFVQAIWNGEVVFRRGRTTLRGEAFIDRWEVPNLDDDPRDISWYMEGVHGLTAGLDIAARWSEIRFPTLNAGGLTGEWDHYVGRLQMGAGYRILRNTGVKIEAMLNRTSGPDPRDNLFAIQWWWAF
jgi:class 3 adenylate cyclase